MPLGTEVGLGPSHIVLDGDPANPPRRGHSSLFSAHYYCGQTAGWIKIPLGTEVGLGRGHVVLDWDPSSPTKKGAHVYCDQTDGWIKMPFGTEVGLGPGDIGTQLPHPWKGAQQLSHFSAHVCYGPTVAHLSYC